MGMLSSCSISVVRLFWFSADRIVNDVWIISGSREICRFLSMSRIARVARATIAAVVWIR